MTGAKGNYETMHFDTDGIMEQEQFHEEGVSDEIPRSLMSYFETSRSRAAVYERLIFEETGDFPSDIQTQLDSVDLCSSEGVMESLNELQVSSCLTPELTKTEALWTDMNSEAGTDVEEVMKITVKEEQLNRGEGYRTERDKRLCEELEMEKEYRRRETEFQEELRRLEEAERLRQAEVALMVNRAQEKLEKEMVLQQEMMNDLKRQVEEERKRRIKEQTRFKEEQEKRQQEEEERRKTEQRLKEERLKLEQDEKNTIQTEKMSTVLKLTKDVEVSKDGFEKQTTKEEKEKMEVEQSTTKQERVVKIAGEMNLDKKSLGKRNDRETNMTKENESARKSKQEVDSVISKTVLTINVEEEEEEERDTTKRKTDKAKEVNKELDKTKQMDEEGKTMNKNYKMVETETSKKEEKQDTQHSRAKGVQCNVGNQNKTNKGQEMGNEIQKKQSREDVVNYEEDIVKLQKVVELQPKMCHEESTVKDENVWKMKQSLTFQQENSAVDVKTRKDNGKRNISISCNFLQKGLRMREKTADKDKSNECGEEGSSKSITIICQETRRSDNNMSTNVKNEKKVSGVLLQKESTSGTETGINGNNKQKVKHETEQEDCQSLQNVFKVSKQHEKNDPVQTSDDFLLQNETSQQQEEKSNITVPSFESVREETTPNGHNIRNIRNIRNILGPSILETEDEEKRSTITRATADSGDQLKSIFMTLNEQDGKTNSHLNCGPIQNERNVKKQCENQKNTCEIQINVTVNGKVRQETIDHGNENVNSGECGEIKASSSRDPIQSDSFNSSERRPQDTNQVYFFEAGNGALDQNYSSNDSLKNVSTNSQETSQSENSISMRSLCGEKRSSNKNSTSFGSRDNGQDGDEETCNRAAILETGKEGKGGSKTTSSSCDSLQNVSSVNEEQSGNKKNSSETVVFVKERYDIPDKTRCNSFPALPTMTKKASQQNYSSSQTSRIVTTSLNCNLLQNLSNNSNQQNCQESKSQKNKYEAVNKDTDDSIKTSSNICSLQNESTVTSQNGSRKDVNEAAIFETGNKEEGSSNVTRSSCDLSTISRETTQNECIISTRFCDTKKTRIGGIDCLINTTATKEAGNEIESTLTLCLPERTEQKRMKWMKDCVSWSSLCLKSKRSKTGPVQNGKGVKRTAAGFVSLPPLSTQTLLQATAKSSLKEVTTVTLQDLSGCSLSSLAQCSRLRSLTLRRCGLKALDFINQLRELCCVDVQENEISYIDCENMTCLRVLRLGSNKLTSVHGLSGADSLAVLDLSHNNVRRIAGLESLKRLQSLSLSHNQLMSTKGLSPVSTLLHLDLSHNHLASVEGLENCALLSSLHLRSNSLSQPPTLNNHVLLRELHLDDNSISSLHSLTETWLPMMQHLSVAKNSITQLPCMSDFVSLETLDLQFNCISELSAVCQSLKLCQFIRELCVSENPLQQETGWRCMLQKAVPRLRSIDGHQTDSLSSSPAAPFFIPASGSFLSLCQTQLQQIRELQERHQTEFSTATSPLDVLKISCRHLNESRFLAEEHRFQHEYGDTSVTSETGRKVSSLGENRGLHNQNLDLKKCVCFWSSAAAAVIQQRWRKHREECTNKQSPSTDTGDRGEGGGRATGQKPEAGRVCVVKRDDERDHAATVIQAFWRGISLRRRLASALAAVSCPGGGQDDSFEEVDLDEFVFDETLLETEWSLRLSEDYTPRLNPEPERLQSAKAPVSSPGPSHWSPPSAGDCGPKQAWTERYNSVERASAEISNRSKTPPSVTVLTGLSERSEKIVEEWGFTNSHTALLMLKRAQKMKSKKQQQQKLKDPNVRLALFKSCASHMRPVEVRNRPFPRNRLHLQVGEAESEPEQTDGETQRTRRRRQTDNNTESERFLPEMSWDVLNGGRVQLVADPGQRHVAAGLCLASQSCPGISDPRRNSDGHTRKEVSSPKHISSAHCKKERISFRDNVVQLSGGWGSGKKSHKVTK